MRGIRGNICGDMEQFAETQGEKRCHINISYGNEDCESMACNFDCASKWKGLGECVSTESPNCICAYRCPN
ncbi:hypothetical protein YC2023_054542 [Brassica napus]